MYPNLKCKKEVKNRIFHHYDLNLFLCAVILLSLLSIKNRPDIALGLQKNPCTSKLDL